MNMVGGLGQKYTKYLAGSVLRNCEMERGIAVGWMVRLVGRVIVSNIFFSSLLSAVKCNWVLSHYLLV